MSKTVWTIDKAHSELGFSVKHMMISKAKGIFENFDAKIEADLDNFTDATIEVTVDLNSINTRNEDRDNHLRSADFFDVENNPNMVFKATDIQHKTDDQYAVNGDLTIRGTTKPVTLDVVIEGVMKDPMSGNEVAGINGKTKINRKEFGLTWNVAMETGGVLVGEDVTIEFELELHKQA